MTRKLSGLALVLLAMSLLFTACPTQFELQVTDAHGDFSGYVSGTARGWSSTIRVELYLEDGIIQRAQVYSVPGTGSESTGFARALTQAPPIILRTNNVELDTLAGASVTTQAIVAAGREALSLIPAPGATPQIRDPGTFAETANGWGGGFLVVVTLSSTAITNIVVQNSNESLALGQPAIPILIDRILRYQTSQVDGVSGATRTSGALQSTVDGILRTAGAPLSMVSPPRGPDNMFNSPRRAVDVLVIGSGAAGLSAAIEAASFVDPANPFAPPSSVTLIEKEDLLGGSTRLSSGAIYAPTGSGDRTLLRDYFLFRAQGYANTGLIETLVGHNIPSGNPDLLDIVEGRWVLPDLGRAFPASMAIADRARVVPGGGAGLVRVLENRARELGVDIMTGVEAHELRTHQGVVVQVQARSRTTNFTFDVRRGVVIATGGFDNDRRNLGGPMESHWPDSREIVSMSNSGNRGDGIRMARAIGADTVYKGGRIGWGIVPVPNVNVSIPNGANILAVRSGGEVLEWVDLSGPAADPAHDPPLPAVDWASNPHDPLQERSPEEDFSVVFYALMRQLERDSPEVAPTHFFQFSTDPFPTVGFVTHSFLAGFGVAYSFADIGALWYNIFNHFFLTPQPDLEARLAERNLMSGGGPFYLWTIEPASLGSMGGLRINTQARVLGSGQHGTTPGVPINGLFAAGEVANGEFFFQQNPAQGSSLAVALTFGRIAGQNAVRSGPNTLLP